MSKQGGKREMENKQILSLFSAAKAAGIKRAETFANGKGAKKIQRAGSRGRKAYLQVLTPCEGVTIAVVGFRRPKKGRYEAHSTVPVPTNTIHGVWAVTTLGIQRLGPPPNE